MNWGQNTYNLVQGTVWWIALAATTVFAVKFISKRQFIQLGGFLILAAIVLVIIDDPSKLQMLGSNIWQAIFK